jgi:flagellar FliL protein
MATKAAPKAPSAEVPAEPPKKKSRLLIIIIALVIVLAGGGAGAWFFLGQKAEKPGQAAKHPEEAKAPIFLPMDSFTVNLQPGESGPDQFLQTSFTLQVADEKQVEQIKQYMPPVRSRLLLLLSSKKASEILTVEGKNKLSQEILDVFKQPLVPGGPKLNVSNVLFTSFVVQ